MIFIQVQKRTTPLRKMVSLKCTFVFLLMVSLCNLGYANEGEGEIRHGTIKSIQNLNHNTYKASSTEEVDLPEHYPESLKTARIEDDGTQESKPKLTNDVTDEHKDDVINKSINESTTEDIKGDVINETISQSTNHTDTMHSKIGVRGGKTGGSKIGGSKIGGTKTRIGGGGYRWRPITRSGGSGGGGGLTFLYVVLGIAGVGGSVFLVWFLILKYTGSSEAGE